VVDGKDLNGEAAAQAQPPDAGANTRTKPRNDRSADCKTTLAASDAVPLGELRQPSGKVVTAWAVEGDIDSSAVLSNTFEIEWPPRSGRTQAFPEIDRAEWFDLGTARAKLNPAQAEFVDRLEALLER
jgi:predicted NUDIX family NTP pyrophosphohydrolase